jgi:flagellar biosynthesis/type III secretory pathway ATPase
LGEIPAARGFPPSVYSLLPKIVERAGRAGEGSITAFFSVLVDGHDPQDPIGDIVRGLLDGHLVLSRELADRGHFPALDVLSSVSRLMPQICPAAQLDHAACLRRLLAARREQADLISIGAYQAGSNPQVDAAVRLAPDIQQLLCQQPHETSCLDGARQALCELAGKARQQIGDAES